MLTYLHIRDKGSLHFRLVSWAPQLGGPMQGIVYKS